MNKYLILIAIGMSVASVFIFAYVLEENLLVQNLVWVELSYPECVGAYPAWLGSGAKTPEEYFMKHDIKIFDVKMTKKLSIKGCFCLECHGPTYSFLVDSSDVKKSSKFGA